VSDETDIGRWALTDEDLEALLLGAPPARLGLSGNPVAEFFADASGDRAVAKPLPNAALRELFASTVPEPVVSPGPDPLGIPSLSGAEPTAPLRPGLLPPESFPHPEPAPPELVEPGPVTASAGPLAVEGAQDLPFRGASGGPPAGVERVAHSYRSSALNAVSAIGRLGAPKLLMVAGLLVLIATAVDALGLYDFPLISRQSVDDQAIGAGTAPPLGQGTPVSVPSTPVESDPLSQSGSTLSLPGALDAAADSTAATTTPTTVVTGATAATTTPTVTGLSTTTLATSTPTSTPTSTSRTTTSTTTTTTTTTSTTSTTTTTTTTTPAEVTVGVPTGATRAVPGDIPAGTYQALVGGTGCAIEISGGARVLTPDQGENVQFILVDGESLLVGEGCPTSYLVS
jgi:hypothetical protein